MKSCNVGQISAALLFAMLWLGTTHGFAGSRDQAQVELLADLTARIVQCSAHPCIGDSEEEIRTLLSEKIVTDDFYYYSDLNVAYPETHGVLQGLIEWDFDDETTGIWFKLVGFHATPELLLGELETVLAGCEMEEDDELAWSCDTKDRESRDVVVDAYFGSGLLLLEIY